MTGGSGTPEGSRWRRAFWMILILAAVIRLPGIIGQGFPQSFYPDETNAIQRSLRFGAEKTANPGWFNKPALAYYLWFSVYGLYYAVGRLFGVFGSPEQFGVWAFNRVAPFLVLGRLVSTLFGLGTVWVTYLFGKVLRDRTLGLVAAFVLTLTYAHVVTGQWVKEDVPSAFFHTAATVLLVSVITRSRVKDSVCAGLLGGLGMATKYYSVGLLIPAAFAHLFPARGVSRRMSARVGLLALFLLLFAAGFFAGSPYNFLRSEFWFSHVLPGLKRVLQLFNLSGAFGWAGIPQANRTGFVDTRNLSLVDVVHAVVESLYVAEGIGLAFVVLAATGAILALVRRRRLDVFMLVAVFGQALFIAVSNRQASEPRHLVVLYPLLAVWIAEAALFLAIALRRVFRRLSPTGTACALVLAATLIPGVIVIHYDDGTPPMRAQGRSIARMLVDRSLEAFRGDTRLSALQWIEANIPAGSSILNDHEVLPLCVNEARADWAIDRLRKAGVRRPDVWTYVRRWQFRKGAALDSFRPTYDVLVVEAPWGAESLDALEEHRRTYDTTWPLEPESKPADVAPVARYTDVPALARPLLESRPTSRGAVSDAWPASTWLLDGRPIDWLVSSEETYNNYDRPKHRASFAVRAAFYDDLRAHYDCRQWSAGRAGRPGPTIRVYDLRRRVSGTPAVVEMIEGGS